MNEKQFLKLFELIKITASSPINYSFRSKMEDFFYEIANKKMENFAPKIHAQINNNPYKIYAQQFYKNLQLKNRKIKNQLKADFIKMHNFLEVNDFFNFALACYQQVETIINFLNKNNQLNSHINLYENSIVALPNYSLIDITKGKSESHVFLKKVLHFYIFFEEEKQYDSYKFNAYYNNMLFIFTARNFIHKNGSIPNTFSENKVIENQKKFLLENTMHSVFRVLNIFSKFIEDLSKGLKKINAATKRKSRKTLEISERNYS